MNDSQLGSRCCRIRCLDIIVCLLVALFALALGLLLGLIFFETLVAALPVIIGAAVILIVLLAIFLILKWCNCR